MSYFRTAILLAAMTALFMGIGFLIGGQSGMVIALVVAAAMNLFAYWNSDKMVLSMYGAREVDERSAPELVSLVRQLAGAAGIPMPRVYVMENPQPNAFATGRNPEHAAVAVTTGLLNTVNREELSGVLAHELGHIKHRDTLLDDHHRDHRRRDLDARQFRLLFRRAEQQQRQYRLHRLAAAAHSRAARCGAGADGDQPDARIRGRPRGRRDQQAPARARLRLAEDRGQSRADPQYAGRAQSGLGASLHRQSAVGRAHGQSLLHAPERREPRGAARGDRARDGRRRAAPSVAPTSEQLSGPWASSPSAARRGPWG